MGMPTGMGSTGGTVAGSGASGAGMGPARCRSFQPLSVEPRVWYNPELRSSHFLVPGLIGFILMLTAVLSTALSVVREKRTGHDGADPDGTGEHDRTPAREDAPLPGDLADSPPY
jgi:hypothetical protein